MTIVQIDDAELNATREAASQMLPWKSEAERLALALLSVRPLHPLLRSEVWKDFIEAHENRKDAREPDAELARAIGGSVTRAEAAAVSNASARREALEDA